MLTYIGYAGIVVLVRGGHRGRTARASNPKGHKMPRRNHRGGTTQCVKPKDGRIRKASFWHAIAAGIKPLSEQVQR